MKTHPCLVAVFALSVATLVTAQSGVVRIEEALFVREPKPFVPGYPIGDIAIGDPKVADFRVQSGRQEVVLVGVGVGKTLLIIWDQRRVKRHEIGITVASRESLELEQEVRTLLKEFPSVSVSTLAGSLVITGAVSSKDDLAAIERIAAAAKVKCVVRYVAPVPAPSLGPVVPASPATGQPTATVPAGTPAVPVEPGQQPRSLLRIRYEVELMEASIAFRTGSFGQGVEPSGRRLYLGQVEVDIGSEAEVFVGGAAVAPKDAKRPAAGVQGQPQTGLRLKVSPKPPDSRGRFVTSVMVETNLPLNTETYDPATWRRSRWEFPTVPNEPFGIVGGDLLASRDISVQGANAMQTTAGTATTARTIPGVGGLPGMEYVPVFGSLFGSRSYKQKTTQLLVVLRPHVIAPEPR